MGRLPDLGYGFDLGLCVNSFWDKFVESILFHIFSFLKTSNKFISEKLLPFSSYPFDMISCFFSVRTIRSGHNS